MNKTISTLVFAVATLAATQSFAVDLGSIASLPVIQNVKIVSVGGGGLAAVQPQALIKFTFRSCGARQFEANIEEIKGIKYVSIVDKIQVDCAGPTFERDYDVQYSSDAMENDRIVILNPQTLYTTSPII